MKSWSNIKTEANWGKRRLGAQQEQTYLNRDEFLQRQTKDAAEQVLNRWILSQDEVALLAPQIKTLLPPKSWHSKLQASREDEDTRAKANQIRNDYVARGMNQALWKFFRMEVEQLSEQPESIGKCTLVENGVMKPTYLGGCGLWRFIETDYAHAEGVGCNEEKYHTLRRPGVSRNEMKRPKCWRDLRTWLMIWLQRLNWLEWLAM